MAHVSLQARRQAPGESRDFVTSVLAGCPEEMRMRVCHVVSELVTNSVRFAAGEHISVDADVDSDGAVDVVVRDEGAGFDAIPKAPGHADPEGWGLVFVDMLAESWAPGGPGVPVVHAHFEPRCLDDEPRRSDPLLDERLRDLLDVRMLLDSVKDYAIFALNHNGELTLWNVGGERLTGYSPDDILGSSMDVLLRRNRVRSALSEALAHGRHEMEGWLYRKDGSRFWGDSVITPIIDRGGDLRGFSVIARDVTWRKQLDEDREGLINRIRHLARTDDLTGLPNRRRWHEELDRELARARRLGTNLCVAMVDLDGFKLYNDTQGHLAGDDLLGATARAWAEAVRTTDMLARYGGDEFALVLPDCPIDEARIVVERMRAATPDPITCSAGLACSGGTDTAESVIRRADAALYSAKRAGRDATAVA